MYMSMKKSAHALWLDRYTHAPSLYSPRVPTSLRCTPITVSVINLDLWTVGGCKAVVSAFAA
jgi:hypothetical protein